MKTSYLLASLLVGELPTMYEPYLMDSRPFNPIHRKNKPNRKNMNLISKRTKSKHNRK